jgi:hypothetical protein
MSQADYEREYSLPNGSICKWKSQLPELQKSDPAGLCARAAKHPELEVELMKWLLERWGWKGYRISTRMCQEQATKIAEKLKITGFVCSRSWAAGFRARNRIVTTTLYGEKAAADHDAAHKYPQRFRDTVASLGIANSNIYNADESLFYPRLQSRKTLCPERLANILRGGKEDRLRIGMLVTTCADGSNDCPLVFSHTARQPHGMRQWDYSEDAEGFRKSNDGTHLYFPTANGWISRTAIAHYLTRILPEHIRAKAVRNESNDRRALLVLDGCGVHFTAMLAIYIAFMGGNGAVAEGPVQINCSGSKTELSDRALPPRTPHQEHVMKALRTHGADLMLGDVMLYVRISPANTTSLLQPADQGLIAGLKAKWRTQLDLLSLEATSAKDATEKKQRISVMQVMHFLGKKMREIPLPTTLGYWAALMDPTVRSYEGAIEEELRAIAEKVVAGREKMYEQE